LQRNLTAGEIVDQLSFINAAMPAPVTNVVIYGHGRTLLNYDNVIRAAQFSTVNWGRSSLPAT
jgi:adenine C2-methylase RlmN of 23S rRNA A2503 and tRNA A37